MPVTPGSVPTELNLGTAPSAPAGFLLGVWQASAPYPDPNNPEAFVRDASVYVPNHGGVDARTTVTETIGAASRGKIVTLTNSAAIAATLDSTVDAEFMCYVTAAGAGAATLAPSTGTIDGAASLVLAAGCGVVLFFDGTNWETDRGYFPVASVFGRTGAVTAQTGDYTAAQVTGAASQAGVQNESYVYAADSGAANVYAVTLAPVPGAYAAGLQVTFKAANANTGASTLNVNGLGAEAIKKSGGATALATGDILAGQIVSVVYDGTNFQIQTGLTGPAGATGGTGIAGGDLFLLGAPDATNLPNGVGIPGLYYGPDIIPASPTGYDDEFNGSSLAGAWTWLQQGAAVATVAGSLVAVEGDYTTAVLRGIYKAVPGATPWEFTAKVSIEGSFNSFILCGLMLYESATGKQMWFGPAMDTGSNMAVIGYGSVGSPVNSYDYLVASAASFMTMYIKIKYDGTNLIFSQSIGGIKFTTIFTQAVATRFTVAPDNIGLGVATYGATNFGTLICDWFRRTL
jgi:hypothetical protein